METTSSIKVITIVGLIILGIILDLGGGPNHDRIGFRYWKNPGPFVQFAGIPGAKGRFLGFFRVLTQAAFSMIGTEAVAVRLVQRVVACLNADYNPLDGSSRSQGPPAYDAQSGAQCIYSHTVVLYLRSLRDRPPCTF